ALAGMDACADLKAGLCGRAHDLLRALDRAGRTVKRGEEAIAGGVEFAASEPCDLSSRSLLVRCEKVAPSPVTYRRRTLGRSNNVREQQRRQHAVRDVAALVVGKEASEFANQFRNVPRIR